MSTGFRVRGFGVHSQGFKAFQDFVDFRLLRTHPKLNPLHKALHTEALDLKNLRPGSRRQKPSALHPEIHTPKPRKIESLNLPSGS